MIAPIMYFYVRGEYRRQALFWRIWLVLKEALHIHYTYAHSKTPIQGVVSKSVEVIAQLLQTLFS